MGNTPVTISSGEYRTLLQDQILLGMVVDLVKSEDSKYSVSKEAICRILNIKLDKEEDE